MTMTITTCTCALADRAWANDSGLCATCGLPTSDYELPPPADADPPAAELAVRDHADRTRLAMDKLRDAVNMTAGTWADIIMEATRKLRDRKWDETLAEQRARKWDEALAPLREDLGMEKDATVSEVVEESSVQLAEARQLNEELLTRLEARDRVARPNAKLDDDLRARREVHADRPDDVFVGFHTLPWQDDPDATIAAIDAAECDLGSSDVNDSGSDGIFAPDAGELQARIRSIEQRLSEIEQQIVDMKESIDHAPEPAPAPAPEPAPALPPDVATKEWVAAEMQRHAARMHERMRELEAKLKAASAPDPLAQRAFAIARTIVLGLTDGAVTPIAAQAIAALLVEAGA